MLNQVDKASTDQSKALRIRLKQSNMQRYFQLLLLVLAAGAIYPLLYLRQNFETSIIEVFQITQADLADYYSVLGLVLLFSYVPSGWLADRFSARLLITFSLVTTGSLGLWFSTIPDKDMLFFIFMGWGVSAGLTFWASLIKSVNLIAGSDKQGMFFGILDGGRGLIEAILGTVAIAIFVYVLETRQLSTEVALKQVIYMYAATCIVLAVIIFLFFDKDSKPKCHQTLSEQRHQSLLRDLKTLSAIPELWLATAIIFCGYQLYWATYSFSAFLQEGFEITAVMAGYITVAKLWMRPIGGIGAGVLGDKFGKENILIISMLTATTGLICMIVSPGGLSIGFLIFLVLSIGLVTYAIRGVYWTILDDLQLPANITGLGIGVISLLAYTPDILLPQLNSYIATQYQGVTVYQVYFGYIVFMGFIGVFAALKLKKILILKKGQ